MTIMSKIKKSKDIHAVLDIGNSKVSCLIGTIDKKNQQKAKVLGFGQHVSQGMMGGKITNMKEIANSIAELLKVLKLCTGFR